MQRQPQHELSGQTYFDAEGDNDAKASHSAESHCLTWRGDPNETGSDCTIVVVTSELQTSTFHVHKSTLCFGSRKSKHFANCFISNSVDKRKRKNRNVVPTAKVELDQRDADNFPILLDFIYAPPAYISSNGTVVTAASTLSLAQSTPSLATAATDEDCSFAAAIEDITTENAVSLRSLAKKFEVDSLILIVNRFIQKDLNFKTGPHYLSMAAEYRDARLMNSAQHLCAENIEQISSKALLRLPAHLFRIVIKSLESFEEDNRDLSYYLSEIVCRYLEKHPKSLCAGLLLELTDPLLMPYIASEAAIGYTALIKELDSDDVKTHWNGLVSLSRRCAKSVVQEYGWSDFSVTAAVDEYLGNNKEKKIEFDGSHHVDSLLFATSFAAALSQAQDDHEAILVEQERMETIVQALQNAVTILEQSNVRKDEHMAKQQWAIEEAKKQIFNMKDQIEQVKQQNRAREQQQRSPPSPHLHYSDEVSSIASPMMELMSPSQVGSDIPAKKNRKIKELRTKNQMRARSIIS
jgi:hypothetical protein